MTGEKADLSVAARIPFRQVRGDHRVPEARGSMCPEPEQVGESDGPGRPFTAAVASRDHITVEGEPTMRLSLLGGFALRMDGRAIALPLNAQRVLAYLSLDKVSRPECDRALLAERLWVDAPTGRARGRLRTAMWRIRQASPDLVGGNTNNVWLADDVDVDVHDFSHAAHRLLSETSDLPTDPTQVAVRPAELLPSWDEDWLMLAREQLRQLWMHALEASARRLLDAGMIPQAIDQLLVVVAEEPLRESAQALLIEAYLREGNMCEARRQLASFARQLWTVLRVRPSRDLCERVGGELNVERLR